MMIHRGINQSSVNRVLIGVCTRDTSLIIIFHVAQFKLRPVNDVVIDGCDLVVAEVAAAEVTVDHLHLVDCVGHVQVTKVFLRVLLQHLYLQVIEHLL